MGPLAFDKYEGLGNDFVVVDAASDAEWTVERVRAICDRRRGIGGDGVLLVLPATEGGDARMRVINADGSIPEMCGNGIRCVAVHLARTRRDAPSELAIETDAGLRRCQLDGDGVRVDMGIVRVGEDLEVEGVALTCADAGNPHAVSLRPVSRADFERLGPRIATSERFPRGTNVEFVRVDAGILHVDVWERGVGPTLACGTGACAVVAVAQAKGAIVSATGVRVRLPGGELVIDYDPASGRTTMLGPARHVFSGTARA